MSIQPTSAASTPAASPPTAPTSAAAAARQAIGELGRAPSSDARRQLGDRFLRAIEGDTQATDLERLIAATALKAVAKPLTSQTSTMAAQRAALDAVAVGVSGPCGPVLATIAATTLQGAYNSDDRCALAPHFLQAIATHGEPMEQELARVALEATHGALYSGSSRIQAETAALGMVQAGPAPAGPAPSQVPTGAPPTPAAVIADYGLRIMKTAYNSDDRFALAGRVLEHLAAGGSALAKVGAEAANVKLYSRSSAVALQERTLQLVAEDRDPGEGILALGEHALRTAYNTDDKVALGRTVLDELGARTGDPAGAAIAAATSRAMGASLDSGTSRLKLQEAAFERLAAPTGESPEHALSKLGAAAHAVGYNGKDKATLGAAILEELGARTTEARVKAQVSYAKQALVKDDHASNVTTQAGAFESILSGRRSVAMALPGVGLSLQVPLIDDGTPDGEAKRILGECVPHNREVVDILGRREQERAAAIPALKANLQKINDEMAAQGGDTRSVRAEAERLRKLEYLSQLASLGGFLATIATQSPIAEAVGAVGVVASLIIGSRARAKVAQQTRAFTSDQDLSFKKLMAQAELESAKSEVAKLRAALQKAEDIHKPLDERYRLLEMTKFVEGTNPDPNAKVELDDQLITIGGLRVPRKTPPPTP